MSRDIAYRLAHEDDLSTMRLIQSKALYDLVVTRSGRAPSAVPITDEPSSEMRHLLRTDPKLAWIAIQEGRPVGFCAGFVREELWFLSDLFVLPEAYGKGIGGELLRRCLAGGVERGARIRAVAASHDLSALRLYIGAGMVARFPLFGIVGNARGLLDLPSSKATIRQAEPTRAWIRRFGKLDEIIWGRRRDEDHRHWLQEQRMRCFVATGPEREIAGYAYYAACGETRRVGPIAALSPRRQLSLLRAIGEALDGVEDVSLEFRIPGLNLTALEALLKVGFRIDHAGQYMASHPFGRFDRYLASGGTLL